jgi:hypothetical protein
VAKTKLTELGINERSIADSSSKCNTHSEKPETRRHRSTVQRTSEQMKQKYAGKSCQIYSITFLVSYN